MSKKSKPVAKHFNSNLKRLLSRSEVEAIRHAAASLKGSFGRGIFQIDVNCHSEMEEEAYSVRFVFDLRTFPITPGQGDVS